MNYYERYVGNYMKKTGALSLMEHGAYTLLLDACYATEKPLPADKDSLYRICSAIKPAEQEAVMKVANEFFPIGSDGLRHNAMADEMIPDAQRRIATAKENGGKGGRPSKTKTQNKPSGFSENNPVGNPVGSDSETQRAAQRQSSPTPAQYIKQIGSAVYQESEGSDTSETAPPQHFEDQSQNQDPAFRMAVALRAINVNVTAFHPTLLDWVAKGITIEVLTETFGLVRMRSGKQCGPINPNYLTAVLADVLNSPTATSTALPEAKKWWESASGIDGKGSELGLALGENENFSDFKIRVLQAAGDGPWLWSGRSGPTTQGFKAVSGIVKK